MRRICDAPGGATSVRAIARQRRALAALALLTAPLVATSAAAQEPAAAAPESAETAEAKPAAAAPLPSGEKREVPDYDGRGGPEATAGDAALWVPRVVFYPAYLATEYLVRAPLGFVVTEIEQQNLLQELTDFFTFGPNNNIGIVPTALFDFGLRSSVGVYAFWDDFGTEGNDLRVHAATGGSDWLRLTVADRVTYADGSSVKLRGETWHQPDGVFYGIGPSSQERNRSRYGADVLGGSLTATLDLSPHVDFEATVGVRRNRFYQAACCDDPSLATRIRSGDLDEPPGYASGFTPYRIRFDLAADSRDPRPAPGSGLRVEIEAEHDIDLDNASDGRWVRYGGTAGAFLDLTGQNRVLSLSLTTLFVDPLGDSETPFTELVTLGGENAMRGFLGGRLLGRSASVATLEYRYPIWAFLDGSLNAAVGNVFGAHLEDFDPELLRVSFWAGIRTIGDRDHSFDLLVGAGSETFADGGHLNTARVLLGAKQGF